MVLSRGHSQKRSPSMETKNEGKGTKAFFFSFFFSSKTIASLQLRLRKFQLDNMHQKE